MSYYNSGDEDFNNALYQLVRNVFFALIMGGLLLWLTGCDTMQQANRITHDLPETTREGCYIKGINAKAAGIYTQADYEKVAAFCSKNLPENYCFDYDFNGLKVKAGECEK